MARDTVADTERMLKRAPDAKAFDFAGVRTYCVLDDQQEIVEDASGRSVRLDDRVATIARGVLTELVRGSSVTVADEAYTVRDLLRGENGDLVRVVLAT